MCGNGWTVGGLPLPGIACYNDSILSPGDRMPEPLKQVLVRVPVSAHRRWKLEAVKRGVPLGKLIEQAMTAYLKGGARA